MIFIVNIEIKNNKKSKDKVFIQIIQVNLNTNVVSAISFLIHEIQLKETMLAIKKFSLQIYLEFMNQIIKFNHFC